MLHLEQTSVKLPPLGLSNYEELQYFIQLCIWISSFGEDVHCRKQLCFYNLVCLSVMTMYYMRHNDGSFLVHRPAVRHLSDLLPVILFLLTLIIAADIHRPECCTKQT